MTGRAQRIAAAAVVLAAVGWVTAAWRLGEWAAAGSETAARMPAQVDRQRLYHAPDRAAMRWREADGRVGLRLHTGREVERAWLVLDGGSGRLLPMKPIGRSRLYRYWEAYVGREEPAVATGGPVRYRFAVEAEGGGTRLFVGPDGVAAQSAPVGTWEFAVHDVPAVEVPDWVRPAVFYQIFPDRFANGDPANDPPGTVGWDARPTTDNFFGGDLQGVIDRAGYLQELGVSAVWFNPVFDSVSNHRYDTRDYRRVDPELGDLATFVRMVEVLHARGIRVVLDGVFNHTGDEFWAFRDVAERGADSPYYGWYDVWRWPLTRQPVSYRSWSGYPDMPELNHDHPEVRRYLFETVLYWMDMGVDGWRLDVANEVPHDFWREFRKVVKGANPQAYLVGEIWQSGEAWLRGDQFDGVMNYRWRDAVLQFFALRRIGPEEFDVRLSQIRADYPGPVFYALLNLLGSHDTERFLTACRGDTRRLKLAVLFQMTYPGAPIVYYGDEVGVQGGRGPDNRRTFPWEPERQDRDLLEWYRRLIALRRSHPVLAVGDVRTLVADDATGVYAYFREPVSGSRSGEPWALVVLNNSDRPVEVDVPLGPEGAAGGRWKDLLTGEGVPVGGAGLRVALDPMQGRVLMPEAVATL